MSEVLQLYWLAGLQKNAKNDWLLNVVTRGESSGGFVMWKLPIGLFPVLALGYTFHDGQLDKITYGEYADVIIPNLAEGQETDSSAIPAELYPFYGWSSGVQRLFRYEVGRVEYLIPAMELIRSLFLHNKTLANYIMQPGGIMTLYRPIMPGYSSRLQLDFTQKMPVRSLKRPFLLEFAWLAVDPEGRRSWDSVYERSVNQRFMTFDPPELRNCKIKFRGVREKNRWLIMEIIEIAGKNVPCDILYYSHPSLKTDVSVQMPRGELITRKKRGVSSEDSPFTVDIESSGSKTDVNQPALQLMTRSSIFEREVEVFVVKNGNRIRYRKVGDLAGIGGFNENINVNVRSGVAKIPPKKVSVAPESQFDNLAPLEFQLLTIESKESSEDLMRLMQVIREMANRLVKVDVLMALCRLPVGRSFSMIGNRQRLCLVAVLFQKGSHPIVLLDVEHRKNTALSTLLIRYKGELSLQDIEGHVLALLGGVDRRGGHWDLAVKPPCPADYEPLRKVMRPVLARRTREAENYFWAEKLKLMIFGRL